MVEKIVGAVNFMQFCIGQTQQDIELIKKGERRFTHPGVSIVLISDYKSLGVPEELETEARELIKEYLKVVDGTHEEFAEYLRKILGFENRVIAALKEL